MRWPALTPALTWKHQHKSRQHLMKSAHGPYCDNILDWQEGQIWAHYYFSYLGQDDFTWMRRRILRAQERSRG